MFNIYLIFFGNFFYYLKFDSRLILIINMYIYNMIYVIFFNLIYINLLRIVMKMWDYVRLCEISNKFNEIIESLRI